MLINILVSVAMALMVLGPIVLVIWAGQRHGWQPRWIGAGALTFVGSQVVHLPLNWGLSQVGLLGDATGIDVQTALVLGLSAGICEELARAAVLTWWVTEVRDHNKATAYGLGHGGIEAVFVGILGIFSVINIIALQTMDLNALGLSPEQLERVQAQVREFTAQPLWAPATPLVERAMAMMNHLFMTLLVLRGITSRKWGWIGLAIGWHTMINAVAVWLAKHHGALAAEASLAVFTALAAWLWWRWRSDSLFSDKQP